MKDRLAVRNHEIKKMELQHKRQLRARDLLLNGDLSEEEYREIKTETETMCENLQGVLEANPDHMERFGQDIHDKGNSLLDIYDFYNLANTVYKRRMISAVYTGNLEYNGVSVLSTGIGPATALVFKKMPPIKRQHINVQADTPAN